MKKIIYLLSVGLITSSFSWSQTLQNVTSEGNTTNNIIQVTQGNKSPTAGKGLEIYGYESAGVVQAYDRDNALWLPLVLNPGGNVGIGATLPRALLDVGRHIGGGAMGTVLARMGEGDDSGEGTYLGAKAWGTQAADYGGKSFSLEHAFYGALNSAINFYRGSAVQGGFMTFATNDGGEKMRIDANGNVGIGTSSPVYKLDVNGNGNFKNSLLIDASPENANGAAFVINSTNGGSQLRAGVDNGYSWIQSHGGKPLYINQLGNDVILNVGYGNVGIGTANTGSYKLAVEGTIGARKIKVTQEVPWADYVFDSSYQLSPLCQVEKFIRENKHLPEVPSAVEVKKDGLDLGENQAILLKKIEELTLYIIEQNKQLENQKQQLEAQRQQNDSLGNRLSEIERRLSAQVK